LIRLVSPWFMLCGAIVAYALGSFVNRAVGLLACLLFLSLHCFSLALDQPFWIRCLFSVSR
jgi:CBS-domain-containing membrane protein